MSNKTALGLDVAFETNRRTAALQARLTGEPQISGSIVRVQDEAKTRDFRSTRPIMAAAIRMLPGGALCSERKNSAA